jgi:hypothetical protein
MLLKIGIFKVVVVARATRPPEGCTKTKHKWHHPWCGDDTCALGWGVGMHRAMVWAKAADHHGAAEAWSGVATEATIQTRKVS